MGLDGLGRVEIEWDIGLVEVCHIVHSGLGNSGEFVVPNDSAKSRAQCHGAARPCE